MSDMRGERLQVMLSPEELTAIDDFRFKHRMPTRAAAVRELLKMGLTVIAADGGGMKSSNYGVFSRGPDGHTSASIRSGGVAALTGLARRSAAARDFASAASMVWARADGAQERTRTFTAVKPLAPEASASTNSTTWARAG